MRIFSRSPEPQKLVARGFTAKAHENPRFAEAVAKLERLAGWRRHLPFTFYARILGPKAAAGASSPGSVTRPTTHSTSSSSRARLRAARDAIAARLHRLLRAAQTDVKRDMEITRDEVRVMTVHGAKGLGSTDRRSRRHHDPAGGPPQRQPRLLPVASASATSHSPHASCGRREGDRHRAGERRA